MTSKLRRKIWAQLGLPAGYAKSRHLPVQREAKALVSIGRNPDGRIIRLAPRAAAAWKKLQAAAARDGIELRPISGFRSVARQLKIFRQKLAAGERIDDILRFVAAPGCSEHHTGRALDLGSPGQVDLDESFARTREFRWLKRHAATFGFHLSYPRGNPHAIGYEPWHWCWQPRR
jgi:D-alanyl-D-alanine carboxypeptidase